MIRHLRDRLHAVTGRLMSRCRVCGSRSDVISYDPRGLWAYLFRRTWCPECCPDHDFNRHRDGAYCDNCGQEPPFDWYER
jgi:anaerobic ribonucleoside-triphosphate reductase